LLCFALLGCMVWTGSVGWVVGAWRLSLGGKEADLGKGSRNERASEGTETTVNSKRAYTNGVLHKPAMLM
jgi:hypothetical protein